MHKKYLLPTLVHINLGCSRPDSQHLFQREACSSRSVRPLRYNHQVYAALHDVYFACRPHASNHLATSSPARLPHACCCFSIACDGRPCLAGVASICSLALGAARCGAGEAATGGGAASAAPSSEVLPLPAPPASAAPASAAAPATAAGCGCAPLSSPLLSCTGSSAPAVAGSIAVGTCNKHQCTLKSVEVERIG